MCHSPSGSRATARSGRAEELADAATEEGGESNLSALLYEAFAQFQEMINELQALELSIEHVLRQLPAGASTHSVSKAYRLLTPEYEVLPVLK
ncbi:hypothetical protein D1007_04126 [Hordeum vulgare]|nr:hypothetical protein D1007_04126 [Hordeum vulgare]